jgi:hypothetical protein
LRRRHHDQYGGNQTLTVDVNLHPKGRLMGFIHHRQTISNHTLNSAREAQPT